MYAYESIRGKITGTNSEAFFIMKWWRSPSNKTGTGSIVNSHEDNDLSILLQFGIKSDSGSGTFDPETSPLPPQQKKEKIYFLSTGQDTSLFTLNTPILSIFSPFSNYLTPLLSTFYLPFRFSFFFCIALFCLPFFIHFGEGRGMV
jgi:hypothetical protein